jgi:hypothetical protein
MDASGVFRERRCDGYFVDLYVRTSNIAAVKMYKKLGYSIYQVIPGYYSADAHFPEEAAFDMRKPLYRDRKELTSLRLALDREKELKLLHQVYYGGNK